ncbi:MAG: NAD-glutamate dehydrogenase [bacterium]|nr:NAD-glutamate dehydrogenase [bacterium]
MAATLPQVESRIRRGERSEADRLAPFADQLFRKAGEAFLDAFDAEALFAIAKDGLAFFDRAVGDAGPVRVEVFNPRYATDGWEAPHTVVRLALGDRPFIVDSVRSELRRQGFTVDHVLHPTFAVVRGADGRIERIAPRRAPTPDGASVEAYEMWFVDREDDAGRRERLRQAVERVLRDVVLATDDYPVMVERASSVATYLRDLRARTAQGRYRERAEELEEYAAFLAWLEDGHFVFLGYRGYDLLEVEGERSLAIEPDSALGLLRKVERSAYREPVPVSQISEALRERVLDGPTLIVSKTNAESTVHRPARMDYIGVKKLGDGFQVLGEHRFLGLLTTKAYGVPADEVPILRMKLRHVLEIDGALPGSHDYKQVVAIFNALPRADLFWADAATVHREIRTIMGLEQERGVRLLVRPDPLARGLAVMVSLPRDRFDAEVRQRVQQFLTVALTARHVDYQLAMGEDEAQARMHFFLTTDQRLNKVDVKGLEREVGELTCTWEDHLRARLTQAVGEREGRRLAERYVRAFDARYKADTSASGALRDVGHLERLGERREPEAGTEAAGRAVHVDVVQPIDDPRGNEMSHVRIYRHGDGMALSDVLPVLEDLGFRVLEQVSYLVRDGGLRLGIDVFKVQDEAGAPIDVRAHGPRLIEAAENILRGEAEHDRLGRLVLYGGLTVREVALLRAYQMHYVQLNAVTSRRFVNEALQGYPRVARAIVALFAARFDPALAGDRTHAEAEAYEAFLDTLVDVSTLPEDQVLRGLANLVRATVRCDYYQGHPWVAFKIASAEVGQMPEPRPMFEIGVSAPQVEGVHLRGGMVARGGIRWSDRPDDFRTEVLGLMKTQMTKNAVIVPVGSKGGFVVKGAPADREALRAFVQAQYRTYVRALLGLTDNLVAGELVHPEGLVVHDGPDPYLVVAADKGTATFSDTANAVAAEMGFWLGDAFASGGSRGYGHKKEGITARGTWAAIERHFRDLGLDPLRAPFTVVGIGDMAGDVFGNGLVYSDKIRLVAAFNHQHVFLDPDPDAAGSFAERKRLFALPRSSWLDYDRALISAGGGVFERGAKRIPLSPEARALLGVDAEATSGQELIKAVLRCRADLLWNGGIGTYVKAGSERHADVGDASNDGVRVDAGELRVRIVGEGGNLGFTQLARIEYARGGGRIHTDAIDNSAGVDLSDHEVNLKLVFQPLLATGELGPVQRDRVLREVTDEVCGLVLRNNARQALALALAERRSRTDLMLFDSLIEYLTSRGTLDATVESLPNRRLLIEREKVGEGLTKPELAIVLAYVKMGLYRRLLETDLPDEGHFQPAYLDAYFPVAVRSRFAAAIRAHPLRREIAATLMTNRVVDLLGPTFAHRAIRDSGARLVEVVRAALIALEVLDVAALEQRLEAAPRITGQADLDALEALVESTEGVVRWLLLNDLSGTAVPTFVDAYQGPLSAVRAQLADLLPAPERKRLKATAKGYVGAGLPAELAAFAYSPSSMGVVEVAQHTGTPLAEVGVLFFALGERLRLGWLRDRLAELPAPDKWSKIAIGGLIMDLHKAQRDLTERYVRLRAAEPRLGVDAFLARTPNVVRRYDDALARIDAEEGLSLAAAGVVVRLIAQAR